PHRGPDPPACAAVDPPRRDPRGDPRPPGPPPLTWVPSVDSLGQGHDDPLWSAHGRHAPDSLVLADAPDQPVAILCQPFDDRWQVIDFERHAAQAQFGGHGSRRSRFVVRPDEPRQLEPGAAVRRPQHDDLGTRVPYANDGVQELAL